MAIPLTDEILAHHGCVRLSSPVREGWGEVIGCRLVGSFKSNMLLKRSTFVPKHFAAQ
jgi:hypothetical protein